MSSYGGRRGTPIAPGTLKRAWALTKMSFGVLRKDKEMLAYPILAGLIIVPFVVLMVLTVVPTALAGDYGNPLPILIVLLFILSIVGTVVMTFFNVAMVASAMKRMDGENPTLGYSLSFAARRAKYVLVWGLFAGAVGFVLSFLSNNKNGGIRIIGWLAGASWSVAKYFALPVIAFNDLGPIKAIKESVGILRRTWGTALVANLGIGLLFFLMIFVLMFIGPPLMIVLVMSGGTVAALIGGAIVLTVILAIIMTYSIVSVVLCTALYRYATTGKAPAEFSESFVTDPFLTASATTPPGAQPAAIDYDSQWNLRHQQGRS